MLRIELDTGLLLVMQMAALPLTFYSPANNSIAVVDFVCNK
jgi:hypothetical protein